MADLSQAPSAYPQLVKAAGAVAKARDAIDPRIKDLSAKMAAALRSHDVPMIELYLTALQAEIKHLAVGQHLCDMAQLALHEVEEDEEFVADNLAELEKLGQAISAAQDSFTRQFRAAKQLENAAEKARQEGVKADDLATRDLERMTREVDDDNRALYTRFLKADALGQQATEAARTRDARGLAEAQKAMAALRIDDALLSHKEVGEWLAGFLKKAEAKHYGAETMAELRDGVNDCKNVLGGGDIYAGELAQLVKAVRELKIEEIDLAKALAALGIDARHKARLSKALGDPGGAYEKGLDALARELGLKTSGGRMLDALKKARVL